MTARDPGLTEVRARLRELVQVRSTRGFDAAERVEYRLLARHEAELLLRGSAQGLKRTKPSAVGGNG